MNVRPKIFIGSSVEGIDFAEAIQQNLEQVADTTVWNQGIFSLSSNTLTDLLNSLEKHDFGVFIFKPDDKASIRNREDLNVIRDNVIFELGLYLGKLGSGRVFYMIPKDYPDLHLPSDLLGVIPGTYDYERVARDNNLKAIVAPFCSEVKTCIKKCFFAKQIGVKRADFFNAFTKDFEEMLYKSKKMRLFFIHSRQWRENNENALRLFLKNKENKLLVFLPNIENEELISYITKNFSDGDVIIPLIQDAYRFFLRLKKDLDADVEIRCFNYFPTYSFYSFDDEAIVAMYPTTQRKKNVPTFRIFKDLGFWDFVEDDIDELIKNSTGISETIINQLI